jgi:dihydroorotate dehydrogenase/Pyruvate/2-oxoacid:ferredoxin oxidoreductase delta subunit
MKDAWVCSQMFHNQPYEEWMEKELPATLKLCKENDCLFIGSCSGSSGDPATWIPFVKDLEAGGCKAVELDTGGPHATFGAAEGKTNVGAPLSMDPDLAYKLTKACVDAVKIPIIFKMTPQCVNMSAVALAVEKAGAGAISANNAFYGTWIDHETKSFFGVPASMGGLMGRPWQLYSLAKIMEITATVKIPVLGGGGLFTYDDCVRHIMGGCAITGMCSSVYSRGVTVLGKTLNDWQKWMDKKGYTSIKDFQSCCVKDFMYLRDWKREKPMAVITPVVPKFNAGKCNACGICERLCPGGALVNGKKGVNGKKCTVPTLTRDYCSGCGWCVGHCPTEAVEMVLAKTGETVWNGYGSIKDWVK